MRCMRAAAQNQAVGRVTVIFAFWIKHLTHLSVAYPELVSRGFPKVANVNGW